MIQKDAPPAVFARSAGPFRPGIQTEVLSHREGILNVLAPPERGTSELLRQCCDTLFLGDPGRIPIYFQFKRSDVTAERSGRRFRREFLTQFVAYGSRDPSIIRSAPEPAELEGLAVPADAGFVESIVRGPDGTVPLAAFRTPLRLASGSVELFLVFDDVHVIRELAGSEGLLSDLYNAYSRQRFAAVFAGRRRALYTGISATALRVDELSVTERADVINELCRAAGVAVTPQCADLIAVQTGGRLSDISAIISSAAFQRSPLERFDQFQRIYTEQILGGNISRRFESSVLNILNGKGPAAVFELLKETLPVKAPGVPVDYWQKKLAAAGLNADHIVSGLHEDEIINASGGMISVPLKGPDADVIRSKTLSPNIGRAHFFTETLAKNLDRSHALMAKFYRHNAALGLKELMARFDGREVPTSYLAYGLLKDQPIAAQGPGDLFRLPTATFTIDTGDLYSPINEICEPGRSAIAMTSDNSIWIAAEIDSKLEADRSIAEFWCDRLEMAAVSCGYDRHRIWLIANAGFDEEARELLADRNAVGSSRPQAERLRQVLAGPGPSTKSNAARYEITIPMGDETELVSVRVLEEVARLHSVPSKAVNKIKTALVEASINAAEHSLSPDRRVQLIIEVGENVISINIRNRGIRLSDKLVNRADPTPGQRRGWGIKLMEKLMDTVTIEETDDGTSITMTKHFEAQQ